MHKVAQKYSAEIRHLYPEFVEQFYCWTLACSELNELLHEPYKELKRNLSRWRHQSCLDFHYMNPIRNWNTICFRDPVWVSSSIPLHEPYKELKLLRFFPPIIDSSPNYMNPIRNWNLFLLFLVFITFFTVKILHEPYKELKRIRGPSLGLQNCSRQFYYMNPIRNWNSPSISVVNSFGISRSGRRLHEPYKELKRSNDGEENPATNCQYHYMNPIRNWNGG